MANRHIEKHYPTRSYRGRTTTRSSFSVIFVWLMLGILVGVGGATGTYRLLAGHLSFDFFKIQKALPETQPTKTKKPTRTKVVNQTITTKKSAERFEFYQLLPGMEVPISDPNEKSNATIPLKPKITESPKTPLEPTIQTVKPSPERPLPKLHIKVPAPQYLIQTGTYRTLAQADRAKAQLISRGFSARLQKIDAEDGIWYRVIVGPFASEAAAFHEKSQLARHKFQGILILQRR